MTCRVQTPLTCILLLCSQRILLSQQVKSWVCIQKINNFPNSAMRMRYYFRLSSSLDLSAVRTRRCALYRPLARGHRRYWRFIRSSRLSKLKSHSNQPNYVTSAVNQTSLHYYSLCPATYIIFAFKFTMILCKVDDWHYHPFLFLCALAIP